MNSAVQLTDRFLRNEAGAVIEYDGRYRDDMYTFTCHLDFASKQRKFIFPVFVESSRQGPVSIICRPIRIGNVDFSFIEKMTKEQKNALAHSLLSAIQNNHLYQNVDVLPSENVVLDEAAKHFFEVD